MRAVLISACLIAGLVAPAAAATLRGTEIHVTSDIVTLGDVFSDVTADAQSEVAKAPPAGKSTMIDSGMLYGFAMTYHLDWRPRGRMDRVIVIRDGDAASTPGQAATGANTAILAVLSPALTSAGAGAKLAIDLDGGEQLRLLAALPASAAIAVDKISFDAANRHFSSTLTDAASGQRYSLAGRAIEIRQVPVPTRRIMQGDTVIASDIAYIDQRDDQRRSDTVEDAAQMVGKVARRTLEAQLPVQARFLSLPTIVKRGERVTMIVNNDGIVLTAEGRALGDAGLGETVQLANAASNKTVEGVVTGPNTAEVRTASTIVAAAMANSQIR